MGKSTLDTEIHTPESLTQILKNSLQCPLDSQLFKISGTYSDKKGKIYKDIYYDSLDDIETGRQLTLKVPKNIKPQLLHNKNYTLLGYINRTIPRGGSIGISLSFYTKSILEKLKIDEQEDTRLAEALEKKSEVGYQNLGNYIFTELSKNNPVTVNIILGHEAISGDDLVKGIGGFHSSYNVHFHKINLNKIDEITSKIEELDEKNSGIIAVVRGGGDLSIFDEPEIFESVLALDNIFITAIGHTADRCSLDRVADQDFETPSLLGTFLKEQASRQKQRLDKSEEEQKTILRLKEQLKKVQGLKDRLSRKLEQKEKDFDRILNQISSIKKGINETASTIKGFGLRDTLIKMGIGFSLGSFAAHFF